MCGRYYVDDETAREIEKIVNQINEKLYRKMRGKDIYPSSRAPVIIRDGEALTDGEFTWGFPNYGKSGVIFNARAETALEKKTFKDSLLKRRCIIPASGFYEWNRNKDKFYFQSPTGRVLLFAGFYRQYQDGGRFVILTTAANESMERIHDRMPLILEPAEVSSWIFEEKSIEFLLCKKPGPLKGEIQGQMSLFHP